MGHLRGSTGGRFGGMFKAYMIMRQERKIGEIFECNGEKIIVKKDRDIMCGCDKCVFNCKPECNDYNCISYVRQDKQDVYFEKVEEKQQ